MKIEVFYESLSTGVPKSVVTGVMNSMLEVG
jgi:hypothetical protein